MISTDQSTVPVSVQGHPPGLRSLFFTEMWERFSYYGMRALLVLFMVDKVRGGMGMDDRTATAVYGLYTACVYLASLPGGWLADRILGARKAVWYGGLVIASGHFVLALPWERSFYLGLILVVIGSGTLKPNMGTLVADLYPEGGARRDAGFTIFYMGVNLGAALGPLLCGYLAQRYGWHWGFALAGVGMVFGLFQFRLSQGLLGDCGLKRGDARPFGGMERFFMAACLAAVLVPAGLAGAGLAGAGMIRPDAVELARVMTYVILGIAALFFTHTLLFRNLGREDKERVGVILMLFLAAAVFWAGFEQAGSSFNLFAERYTDRWIASLHHEVPAEWFQTLGPVFVIALAPVFAGLWVALARSGREPSIPVKFGLALLLLASGFLVMAGAARGLSSGGKAWPTWLIATYLLHTFGELCLSPVGLSAVTRLAPRQLLGQMMGIWFLATSLGNLLAGLLAGEFSPATLASWPLLYLKTALLPAAAGIFLIVLAGPVVRLMKGAR